MDFNASQLHLASDVMPITPSLHYKLEYPLIVHVIVCICLRLTDAFLFSVRPGMGNHFLHGAT